MMLIWLLLLLLSWRKVDSRCGKTRNGQSYPLTIGFLSTTNNDLKKLKSIQQEIKLRGETAECFQSPHYLTLDINETLKIPSHGWTWIQTGIHQALVAQAANEDLLPNLIIGPFYTNLALMLQRMDIPYLVTDYKGFDWTDMSRAQDRVNYKTLVEIRPSVQAQNLAVADLFLSRNWKTVYIVMPDSVTESQECKNLVEQLLNQGVSVLPYTVDPHSKLLRNTLQELMNNAKLNRQTRIIICSPEDSRDNLIELVLIQVRNDGILEDKEFSFVLVDSSSQLASLDGEDKISRLGLFRAQCELLAFRYIIPQSDDDVGDDDSDPAATDAAKITSRALSIYLKDQNFITNEFSSERFLRALKLVRIVDGQTGYIQFDKYGQRTNYTLYLYNHGGEYIHQLKAKWKSYLPDYSSRLEDVEATGQAIHKNGIFPPLVKIVVVEETPFVIPKYYTYFEDDGNDRYEGFTIDLIKQLASDLKFKYEVVLSPSNSYGTEIDNTREWDGMVGEILAGNATLAFGALSINSQREQVIDFSLGVLKTGVNFLFRRPAADIENNMFKLLRPFSLQLWLSILGAAASVGLILFVMDFFSNDRRFTVKETVWFTLGTLFNRGSDFAPVPISQRVITTGYLFFVLIMLASYTACLFVSTTPKKDYAQTFASSENIIESEIGITTVRNSATMSLLASNSNPILIRLLMKVEQSGLVDNPRHGIYLANMGTHAFLYDSLINEAVENIYCDLKTTSPPILYQEHGIGMKSGAKFKGLINNALLKLKENGFIAILKTKWWNNKNKCQMEWFGQAQIGLEHTLGVFLVALLGVVVALLLFISKIIYVRIAAKRGKQQKDNNHSVVADNEFKSETLEMNDSEKGAAV